MTSSKSARLRQRAERRKRAERRDPDPRTQPFPHLRTAIYDAITEVIEQPGVTDYDATTITFTGISAPGLPDADVTAAQAPPRPLPRTAALIGDALALEPGWAEKFAILPCGHCGTEFDGVRPADLLHLWNPLMTVKARAWEDGWRLDYDHTLTCPDCQQTKEWQARQGQMELHRFGEPCDRHDLPPSRGIPRDSYRCTCPAAVVAVDVMLTSEDYLGSGRGRHAAVTR